MALNFRIVAFLCFCTELIFCQSNWQKINSEQFQTCEDIAITKSGIIYVSLRYKNLVLESRDLGNSWVNIANDTFRYNPFHYSKEFHVDDQDRIIQFLGDGGLFVGRFYKENEGFKLLDGDVRLQELYNAIKHDENGISYTFQNNRIIRYNKNWSEAENIIILPVKIVGIFPYSKDVNYALGYDNDKYHIYKFNTSNFSFIEIYITGIIRSPEDFYISKNGHIFIASNSGLFFSNNPSDTLSRVQLHPKYSKFTRVISLLITKSNHVIVKTNNSCFITENDGQSWIELSALNNNFPLYSLDIEKIQVLDTSLAIAMVNEDNCGHKEMRILRPGSSGWVELKLDYSLWNFSNVFKNLDDRLFAKPDYCSFLYSENEGETWSNLIYDGAELNNVFSLHSKELIGIDIYNQILISNDNGNNFSLTNFQSPGIYYTGHVVKDSQYSLLFFGIKNIQGDFIDSIVVYKYENNNWSFVGGSYLPYPPAMRYYITSTNKLYAYAYISQEVYVSTNDGLNWQIDTTFKEFKTVVDLKIENNGTILVSGEKFNGETNLFESDGSFTFKPTSSYFENKFVGIYDKYYPKIIAINNIDGISISDDGGHVWRQFNSGLPIFGKEFIIYNSLYWDSEDYLFVSIAYDGLYKTINKITTDVSDLIKSNMHAVYPNPIKDKLYIEFDKSINANSVVLKLFTLSGVEIQSHNLEGNIKEINLDYKLSAGYYLYEIRLPNGILFSGRLVKI